MGPKQNLMPNVSRWVALVFTLLALAVAGMLEQRTRFVLDDGTVVSGTVESEDDVAVVIERRSKFIQRIEKSRIVERDPWNVEFDLNLGLDLRGGTTLRYQVDLGEHPEAERLEILNKTVETFRKRIDNLGVLELSIVAAPPDEILVELPSVTMEESLAFEQLIQRLGTLRFMIVAQSDSADNLNLATERQRLEEHLATLESGDGWTPKSVELAKFDIKGASGKTYRWFPYSQRSIEESPARREFPFELLEMEDGFVFTGESLKRSFPDVDRGGRQALGFEMHDDKGRLFGEFTEKYLHRQMAIVLDGEIHSAPELNGVITTRGIIEGGVKGFTTEEIKALSTVFSSGSLRVTPELLSKATIGPSLGEASIQRGVFAGIVSSILVVAFILWFYGLVGIMSSLTLLTGVFLLVGGLGFLEATLTMPGIAGIVLTIGMAIDQNILINERVREERAKGKTVPQAIKNGFERAFVTIFDAQATTFLTGAILYWQGDGPVKGFAVTLMLGIVATMFAAIVGQKILFAIGLDRGWFENLKLREILPGLAIPFTRYFKKAVIGSVIVCTASLVVFLTYYDDLKGLDFAGGFQTRVSLKAPLPQAEVEAKLQPIYPGAQVVSMRGVDGTTSAGSGEARDFMIKIRETEGSASDVDVNDLRGRYFDQIERAFGELLVATGVEGLQLESDDASQKTTARFVLNLDRPAPADRVESRLRDRLAITSLSPTGAADAQRYEVAISYPSVVDADKVTADVASAIANFPGGARLSDPMPESRFIGPRVGKELRNSAIIAMFWAIIGILLYVRVRFADFNYGIAACVALVHDVAFSLGVMTIAHKLGVVDCEIDLTTIGALLTLIGFSLNDTIVIFDRVRENIARSPGRPLTEIVDLSVNQTMSRTILTSATVIVSLLVLFFANYGQRNVLEGFSFVMLVGCFCGVYSTVYIAAPMLVWLDKRSPPRKRLGTPTVAPQSTVAS